MLVDFLQKQFFYPFIFHGFLNKIVVGLFVVVVVWLLLSSLSFSLVFVRDKSVFRLYKSATTTAFLFPYFLQFRMVWFLGVFFGKFLQLIFWKVVVHFNQYFRNFVNQQEPRVVQFEFLQIPKLLRKTFQNSYSQSSRQLISNQTSLYTSVAVL